MKRIAFFASSFIAGILLISTYSCKDKNAIDYSVMHVYQPQELQKIIDNAFKIEMIGKPTVTRNQHSKSQYKTHSPASSLFYLEKQKGFLPHQKKSYENLFLPYQAMRG